MKSAMESLRWRIGSSQVNLGIAGAGQDGSQKCLTSLAKNLNANTPLLRADSRFRFPCAQLLIKRLLHLANKDVRALVLALEWANQHQQREHHRVTLITDGMSPEQATEAYRQMLRDTRVTPYMPGEERE